MTKKFLSLFFITTLCSCGFNNPYFVVDPYLLELTDEFIDLKSIAHKNGYQFKVVNLTQQDRLHKIINLGRPTIISSLLSKMVDDSNDNAWQLDEGEAPYIFDYTYAKNLVAPDENSLILVCYLNDKDRAMLEESGLHDNRVLYHQLNEQTDYQVLFRRYSAQDIGYIILLQRDFTVDIDSLIIDGDLNNAVYITDRLSKSAGSYYFLAKDYDLMMKNFKEKGEKRIYNQLYLLK